MIHSGKLLENNQKLSDLNLNADANGSSIIHLVISRIAPPKPPTPEPPVVVPVAEPVPEPAPVVEPPPAVENILRREPVVEVEPPTQTQATPTAQPPSSNDQDDDSWQNDELKQYFKHWDLSIRCHQLNEKHKHLGLVYFGRIMTHKL